MKTERVREPRQLDAKQWRTSAIDPRAFGGFYSGGYKATDVESGIGIVSVCGPLSHHAEWWLDSYDAIVCRVEDTLADPDASAVVLCFDSPGGDASGVEEAHRKIKLLAAKYGKPLYAYSNESCYSAAYWLACACDEIWLPPTGGVGSVGVIAEAVDVTVANAQHGVRIELVTTGKHKADGHPDRPLTDEILARVQDRVDKLGDIFFASVAAARGMKPEDVEALQASTFLGADAENVGLADGISGWDSFLEIVRAAVGVDSGKMHATTTKDDMAQKLLKLTAAVTAAQTALAAAKTDEERGSAATSLAAAIDAKVKYSKRTRTDEVEEDDGADDEESEDSSDSAPITSKSPSSDSPASSDDAEGEDDADAEDGDDADEGDDAKSRAKAIKAMRGRETTSAAVYDAIVSLTGKRNLNEAVGALAGIKARLGESAKLAERVARIESTARKDKVSAMLAKAASEGRIGKTEIESLRVQGAKDSKWLKGYLASLPKGRVVRTVEEGAALPRSPEGEQADLSIASMTPAVRKMYEDGAAAAGVSLDKYLEAAKAIAIRTVTARPTH